LEEINSGLDPGAARRIWLRNQIAGGLRPTFVDGQNVIQDLTKRMWDEDPSKRPCMAEVSSIVQDVGNIVLF
jgi:hypothetical protein